MVLTSGETSIQNRFSNFVIWLWGLIYLFFSTIFTDHKKLGHNSVNGNGGGSNMKGLGGGGSKRVMGGGWGPKFRRWRIEKQISVKSLSVVLSLAKSIEKTMSLQQSGLNRKLSRKILIGWPHRAACVHLYRQYLIAKSMQKSTAQMISSAWKS